MNYALMLNPSLIRPLIFRWKFGFKTVGLAGLFLVAVLIGFYVFQINAVTQSSFAIADYDQRIAGLDKELKGLQINFSGLSSLSNLEALMANLGYEKVGKVQYIQVLESSVAQKPR